MDENGIVHIVAASNDGKSVQSTVHYTIAEDLTVEKEYLPKLYYQESEAYLRHTEGLIVGEDGGLYYIEAYRYSGTSNLLSVAKLSETAGEVPTLVDVIEIPDSMDQGLMHLRDATVVFFSDNDIYYFEIEGLGD